MTPDELREKIERAIGAKLVPTSYAMAIKYELADAVMPVLAEALAERDAKIAELRSLLRARDENLHVEAEGWKDMVSALSVQEARAKVERDVALWLHAEARQVRDYVNAGYDALQTAYADAGQQLEAVEAERDRLSTLLRGMARRASHSRRLFRRRASRCNIFMHERNLARAELARLRAELAEEQRASAELAHQFNTVDAELARMRERAVVLPEDWREQIQWAHEPVRGPGLLPGWIYELIESWRPSTGDTDGPAKFDALFPPDAASEAFRVRFEVTPRQARTLADALIADGQVSGTDAQRRIDAALALLDPSQIHHIAGPLADRIRRVLTGQDGDTDD